MSETTELSSPLGLIAGNGMYPLEFARNASNRGYGVVAAAIVGEADEQISTLVDTCVWLKLGEVGRLLKTFKEVGVRQAAFAGGITRVKLFGGVKVDLKGAAILARVRSRKDDALLRGVAEELERNGIEVFAASALLEESVPGAGCLTKRSLSKGERADAQVGWEAAHAVGLQDIGQTVVAHDGVIVAVEAVEGTDAAIQRGGLLAGTHDRRQRKGGCVIVKRAKAHQDLRFDLPTIGVKTIESMYNSGATALVVEAKRALVLEPRRVVELANQYEFAVEVWPVE